MSAWLPGRRFACMLSPFRPRAPLFRTPQLLRQPRPHHLTFANTAERPAVFLTSLHPHDWTGLRIGPASTDCYDIAYWKRITSTYARKMIIEKTPIGTSGHALVWPHQVNCSLPKYTDGRQQFWKGCQTQPSKTVIRINRELRVQGSLYTFALVPINVAVCGDETLGWGHTGAAVSLEPLGGLPDMMCALTSIAGSCCCKS